MIATTMLIGALIRLVVALWASAGATLQSTRSLESIVRTAHEFQEGRTARLDIKHKEILFDHSVARLGFHVLRSDQDILVVTFSPTSAKKRYPLTTAYVR